MVIMRQSMRSFVERCDFRTSIGYGDGRATASGSACAAAARSGSSPTSP
jgi:hypothetical protein